MIEEPIIGLGAGLLFGFLAGKAFKFLAKVAMIIIGVFVLVLAYLSYKGWIAVNWTVVENQTRNIAFNASQQVMNIVNHTAANFHNSIGITAATPVAGVAGFMAGFIIGLRH